MALTTNTALYNFQSDVTAVSIIGQNLTDDTLALYSINVPVQDPVSNYPKDRIFGRKKSRTNIFGSDGELADITLQNVEINEYTGTLTIADNEVFEIDKTVVEGYRNVLEAVLLGEIFYETAAGDQIKPLGVGGNVKLTSGMLRNKDWKYFFDRDSKCVRAYTGELTSNPFLGAYNKTSLSVMLEMKCQSNADTDQVLKYTGVCFGNAIGNEGEDRNTVAIDADFITDFRIYNQFMKEGFSTSDVDAADATTIYRLNVDYIVAQSGGADPTDFGTNGQTACIIDTDDGTFAIKTTNGTDAWSAITGGIGQGCLIFSNKVSTGATVAAAVAKYALVAVKTAGATGTGTAVGTTVTSNTTYTLGTTYDLPIYNFDFATGQFVAVTSTAQL